VRRGALDILAADYERDGPPKGEIVLLVAPPGEDAPALDGAALDDKIRAALQKFSLKDAASVVSADTGQPRRKVYARALELSGDFKSKGGEDEGK
jgi:16S rRNA (cytidine1402-2'-O)-methyltransferase